LAKRETEDSQTPNPEEALIEEVSLIRGGEGTPRERMIEQGQDRIKGMEEESEVLEKRV